MRCAARRPAELSGHTSNAWKTWIAVLTCALAAGVSQALLAVTDAKEAEYFAPRPLRVSSAFRGRGCLPVQGHSLQQVVNLARFGDRRLFYCNYGSLGVLDLAARTAREIPRPERVDVWNPTGVAYDPNRGRLYVANYHGRNVLAFAVGPNGEAVYETQFRHPRIVAPEGISVSADGRRIALADYDGDAVHLLNAAGEHLWSATLHRAHSAAIEPGGRFVIATGLIPPRIVKLEIATGRIVRERGAMGWRRDKYLWPAGVAIAPDGQIAVCDAHTGQVSLLDDDLNETRCFGGNGPERELLNMPYHLVFRNNGRLMVADTFKGRLLELDRGSGELLRGFRNPRKDVLPQRRRLLRELQRLGVEARLRRAPRSEIPAALGVDYRFYVRRGHPCALPLGSLPGLPEDRWRTGYMGIRGAKTDVRIQMPHALATTLHLYWINAGETSIGGVRYGVVGSPQCPFWTVVREDGLAAPVYLKTNLWLRGDVLADAEIAVSLRDVAAAGETVLSRYLQSARSGGRPLSAVETLLRPSGEIPPIDEKTLAAGFRDCFTTSSGKRLAESCVAARNWAEVARELTDYDHSVQFETAIPLNELFIVRLLRHGARVGR